MNNKDIDEQISQELIRLRKAIDIIEQAKESIEEYEKLLQGIKSETAKLEDYHSFLQEDLKDERENIQLAIKEIFSKEKESIIQSLKEYQQNITTQQLELILSRQNSDFLKKIKKLESDLAGINSLPIDKASFKSFYSKTLNRLDVLEYSIKKAKKEMISNNEFYHENKITFKQFEIKLNKLTQELQAINSKHKTLESHLRTMPNSFDFKNLSNYTSEVEKRLNKFLIKYEIAIIVLGSLIVSYFISPFYPLILEYLSNVYKLFFG